MAKPKRTVRLPIMLTHEEALLIDDFRFRSRFATRAGAMRELMRQGLRRVEEAAECREISAGELMAYISSLPDAPLTETPT